jgi:hypothetical protein
MKRSADEKESSWTRVLPLLISFASLIISLSTLWYTRLEPFNLKVVHSGRVDLTSNPTRPNQHLGMGLQFVFNNDGARQGYVQDMALVLKKADESPKGVFLRSVLEMVDDSLNLGKEIPPPKLQPFVAFPVKAGETVVKKFVFVPDDPNSDAKFETGRYDATPYTREAGAGKDWRSWESIRFEVDIGDLEQLSRTAASPSPDGKTFWITQSKATLGQEDEVRRLKTNLGVK